MPEAARLRPFLVLICLGAAGLSGCGASNVVDEPLETLRATDVSQRNQLAAMDALDAAPEDEAYLAALHRVVWRPGYTVAVREAAVDRLREHDLAGLKRTLRQQLPRMTAWEGLTMLCALIAEEEWTDLSPALVSSWARANPAVDDADRPEHLALARMYGEQQVPDVVFELFVSSRRVSEQGLRTRCWALLHRLGARERLVVLLAEGDVPEDDLFLLDLRAGAEELGVVPHNREEILWLRQLRQPEARAFWEEIRVAIAELPPGRATTLEMRDLPVVVAAARHDPALLTASERELYDRIDSVVRGQRHYAHGSRYDGSVAARRERLYDWRNELTWGDLAAMLLAVRALEVPQVVAHLFEYAARDRADETTEYGGVIALDERGRFEVLEFPPRIRHHDQKFLASQAMLDAAYTSLFHFHFHVQKPRNGEFAGPGMGDVNYADNTRANCLVLTSVRDGVMNVDYYRHGRVLVDLGVIERAGATAAASARRPAPS